MAIQADERRVHTRIRDVIEHISYYSFQGQARLAREAGVSRSAVSRLLNGLSSPSYTLICALTQAIEIRLGKTLDPRELVNYDGQYPTPSVCDLVGCRGYFPNRAYEADGTLKPMYRTMKPGEWSLPPDKRISSSEL